MSNKLEEKYKTTIEIDRETEKKLKLLASQDERSLASYIRKILINHVTDTLTTNNNISEIEIKKQSYIQSDTGGTMNFATNTPIIKNNKIF